MRTNKKRAGGRYRLAGAVELVLITVASALLGTTVHAAEEAPGKAAAEEAEKPLLGADWKTTKAGTNVEDKASLQRGARNFVNYCLGCHSMKYERWSRMAQDLDIPEALLQKDMLPPGDKPADYILTTMPAKDSETWFGKTPPDLSLMARSRGKDYLYQLFTTYYVDPRGRRAPTICGCPRLPCRRCCPSWKASSAPCSRRTASSITSKWWRRVA